MYCVYFTHDICNSSLDVYLDSDCHITASLTRVCSAVISKWSSLRVMTSFPLVAQLYKQKQGVIVFCMCCTGSLARTLYIARTPIVIRRCVPRKNLSSN